MFNPRSDEIKSTIRFINPFHKTVKEKLSELIDDKNQQNKRSCDLRSILQASDRYRRR